MVWAEGIPLAAMYSFDGPCHSSNIRVKLNPDI
jgi:hypothetical protein